MNHDGEVVKQFCLVILVRLLEQVDQQPCGGFGVEIAQETPEAVGNAGIQFFFIIPHDPLNQPDEILIEESFELVAADGVINAVQKEGVLLYIVNCKIKGIPCSRRADRTA